MNRKNPAVIAIAALLWLAPTVVAQTPTDTTAQGAARVATLLNGGVMGELLSVSVPRAEDEIARLLDEAHRLEKAATGEIENGRRLAIEAQGRIDVMKAENETAKTRRDAAKKNKDQAAAAEADAVYKKQSRELKYLMQLQDAVNADADRLEAAKAAASATARALERERDVVRKQAEIGAGTPTPEAVEQYRGLLRGMLESQREAAAKSQVAADKRMKLAEQRLKQLAALSKLSD